jgi:MerR family transcriptional regulator, light-induced transcriptional regulator
LAIYSIKDLEKLTGVKAHTLRIWEQRYDMLCPHRTDTNIRYYTDEQAKKLLKVSALYHQGIKISHIANMNDAEINASIMNSDGDATKGNAYIEKLTIAMIELSEVLFITTFNDSIAELGFKQTVTQILYPFLEKIGVLWQVGDINPAQEHFISNLIRQKLISEIDKIFVANSNPTKKAILFIPEGDLHELGLLFYSYILQTNGYQVIYLGQSVPANDLFSVAETYKCAFFVTSVINPAIEEVFKNTIKELFNKFPGAQLHIAGSQKELFLHLHPAIHKIDKASDFQIL